MDDSEMGGTVGADVEPRGGAASPRRVKEERPALRNLRRELSEAELQTPGALKLLLDELERLDTECDESKELARQFYERDKEVATLRERLKGVKGLELVYSGTLVIGSLLVGYAPGAWAQQPTSWLALVAGGVLMGVAFLAKWVRR